ncbi:MAG TPA: VIT family protein [Candidatus Chromulinivoraceae bacterium]|nr:VIT family protein [Candidatus Chromulinivoraceae bacterium]
MTEKNERSNQKLNWLRAAVLGANDGIVSIAGLVVGVAGASNSASFIFTAGTAGIVAGALSMAVGEYVSVSSQRDSERALLDRQNHEINNSPDEKIQELAAIYEAKGLSSTTAAQVASELSAHDAFRAHADARLGIDPDDLTNPWHAAVASAASFTVGSIVPIVAILLPPATYRVPVAFTSVIIALAITGMLSAKVGGANPIRATLRVVAGGAIAMAATYGVGILFGVSGI